MGRRVVNAPMAWGGFLRADGQLAAASLATIPCTAPLAPMLYIDISDPSHLATAPLAVAPGASLGSKIGCGFAATARTRRNGDAESTVLLNAPWGTRSQQARLKAGLKFSDAAHVRRRADAFSSREPSGTTAGAGTRLGAGKPVRPRHPARHHRALTALADGCSLSPRGAPNLPAQIPKISDSCAMLALTVSP